MSKRARTRGGPRARSGLRLRRGDGSETASCGDVPVRKDPSSCQSSAEDSNDECDAQSNRGRRGRGDSADDGNPSMVIRQNVDVAVMHVVAVVHVVVDVVLVPVIKHVLEKHEVSPIGTNRYP